MPSPDTESTGGNKVTGHGDYGPRDNDVRASMRSYGQNRDQNPGARDRDGGKDKKEGAEKGMDSKEFKALAAQVANMEAFLKEKHGYDPKHAYAKDKQEEAAAPVATAAKPEPVKLPRRAVTLPHFDY